ncbi:MAG: M15 family metallopeptidase [Actinobacteria bacterium]|nr:M15 family metallopeptidase [Actinomycetota bacterium]
MVQRPSGQELGDPRSLSVLVNKLRPLEPIRWVPEDLVMPQGIENPSGHPVRAIAAGALARMAAAAAAAGLPLQLVSGYRGFELQRSLFEGYSAEDGVAAAETYSARPGHSEHQTGLAVDLDDGGGHAFESAFGETVTGRWLREHAPEFGFILRYEQGEQPVVGYIYEPWHFRYVGAEIALDMRAEGIINYEDYVGAEPAPDYAVESDAR